MKMIRLHQTVSW